MTQKKERRWDSIKRKWADEVDMEEARKAEITTSLLKPAGKNPYYLFRGTDCIDIYSSANSRDNHPLRQCPMCPVQAPLLTPIGLIALVGLLSAVAAITIAKRKRC